MQDNSMQKVFLIGDRNGNLISYEIAPSIKGRVDLAVNIYKDKSGIPPIGKSQISFELNPNTQGQRWIVSANGKEVPKSELIFDIFEF
jgi:hypothetical protein